MSDETRWRLLCGYLAYHCFSCNVEPCEIKDFLGEFGISLDQVEEVVNRMIAEE